MFLLFFFLQKVTFLLIFFSVFSGESKSKMTPPFALGSQRSQYKIVCIFIAQMLWVYFESRNMPIIKLSKQIFTIKEIHTYFCKVIHRYPLELVYLIFSFQTNNSGGKFILTENLRNRGKVSYIRFVYLQLRIDIFIYTSPFWRRSTSYSWIQESSIAQYLYISLFRTKITLYINNNNMYYSFISRLINICLRNFALLDALRYTKTSRTVFENLFFFLMQCWY